MAEWPRRGRAGSGRWRREVNAGKRAEWGPGPATHHKWNGADEHHQGGGDGPMTIWISAPAMRRKLRRRRKSLASAAGLGGGGRGSARQAVGAEATAAAAAWCCCSVPSEVRRMNCRCMRSARLHEHVAEHGGEGQGELKPAYM